MTDFDPGNRLIVALDVPTRVAAEAFIERLDSAASFIKIGLELYIAEGPGFVRYLAGRGHRIMLDLKLHDTPATVARAVSRARTLGVELLTVHVGGGRAMLEAAQQAAAGDLRLLGVTVLTSLDESSCAEVGIAAPADVVVQRARLASSCGLHGVVASPLEAKAIREQAPELCIVTPGVRPTGADVGDQKRTSTPAEALAAGADLVVVGRPIRDARDPAAAARAIVQELLS